MDIQKAKALLNRKSKTPGADLLRIIDQNGFAAAPGCHDAMSAAIVRKTIEDLKAQGGNPRYNCAYGSGWGFSAMTRYMPDRGIHDRSEIVKFAQNLVEAAHPYPVVLDAETGFGPTLAIPLLVKAYAEAGIAMMHIEDQPLSERACGHQKKIVDELDTMEDRLKMAILTREAIGSDMLIMARTDAWDAANGGKDEAMRRGKAFIDLRVSGCKGKVDFIWSEYSTPDPGLAREFSQEMRRHDPNVRLGFNFSPNMDQANWFRQNKVTPATLEQYADMGYVFLFHTVWSAKVQMQAMYDWTLRMMQEGPQALYDFQDQLYRGEQGRHPTASGQQMSRTDEFQQLELFIGGERVQQKIEKSKGYGILNDLSDVATTNTP